MRDNFIIIVFVTAITAISGSALGGIYKYIDENGNVAYGDKPVDGAKKMKIRLRPTPVEEEDEEQSDDDIIDDGKEVDSYKSLELLHPKNDKVVSERSGRVQVILMPTPRLSPTHQMIITVDGKDVSRGRHSNLSLSKVRRGSHTVSGRIVDANGTVLVTSPSATFHVIDSE